LWDTEASFSLSDSCSTSICDLDQQAAFLVRHYMLHLSRNVQRYYWYAWDDTWGTLWNSSGVLKTGVAYQQAYNWLVGATLSQACSADANSTWTCGITRPGGYQGLVVWNPSTSVSFTAPSQYTQARDIYGGTTAVASSGVVNVDFKPVLLETGTAAPAPTPAPTPDFSILPDSTATVQVPVGQSASVGLSLSPQSGAFSNAIQITCSGLPAGSSCKLSPSTVTPGASPAATTLTISADATLASARVHNGFALALWMPLFGVTVIGAGDSRRKKILMALLVLGAVIACVGCGGSQSSSAAKAASIKQAAYTVTVTATSGSLQHSVMVPFAVQ
jgi:hypothetical protein